MKNQPWNEILPFFEPRPILGGDLTPQVFYVTPDAGRNTGNTSVTITGVNFRTLGDGTLPTVEFGTDALGYFAATSVVVVNSTTITCNTPAGTTDTIVNVRVTIQGVAATLHAGFSYYGTQIFSITPNWGVIAGGTTVLIEGANFEAGSTVTFGGSAGTSVAVIDAQHISVVTPNHATGAVDVVVTGTNGTATLRQGFRYTLLVRGDDIRRMPGIQVTDALNNTPNTATFTVDGTSAPPIVGEKIEIVDTEDSNRLLFAGNIQSVTQIFEEQTDQLAWQVTCVDFTWLFNRRRPFGIYEFASATDIVKDLVQRFAPGFTAAHVQSNLARVNITLDGTKDLVTVLNDIAAAIGGGHWYVDYNQDVHFFHIQPASLPPVIPMGLSGPNLTLAVGSAISSVFQFPSGFYAMQHTFVYSDGTESQLQPLSNMVFMDGLHQPSLSSIPTGATVGSLTCTKRRIYFRRMLNSIWDAKQGTQPSKFEEIVRYVEIPDNTTTTFSSDFGSRNASVTTITDIAATVPLPRVITRHPPKPTLPPNVRGIFDGTQTGGKCAFKMAYVYRDGSVSYPSNASETQTAIASTWNITNTPIGPAIGGADVIARILFFDFGLLIDPISGLPTNQPITSFELNVLFPNGVHYDITYAEPDWINGVGGCFVIPDNTTTAPGVYSFLTTALQTGLAGRAEKPFGNTQLGTADPISVWPNPDGPSLETNDISTLTDTDTNLLKEPGIKVTTDGSQVRNRIYVVGAGSVCSVTSAVGDSTIAVADPNAFSSSGGQVKIGDLTYTYTGLSGDVGAAFLDLAEPLTKAVPQGTDISNFFQADDLDAQREMSKALLDFNGLKTDGIIEGSVEDRSLTAAFQLFMRGFAELELFARPIIKVNYSTRDPKTASGKTVTIDISDPPVKGTFLIQSVSIDQIHDEADMLTPRYNVSASSVKFELTDLLLQILADTNQSSGGNGGSNLTGIQSVQPATPAVMDWIADPTVAWLPSGTNTVNGIGIVSGTVAGTTSAAGRSDGFYLNFTPTGTTINTTSSLTTTINQASSDYDWTWECVLVIPSANQDGSGASIGAIGSALRIYAGACTAIVPDSDGTTRRAIFRFAPSFGDPGWVGITADGSNRTVSARVAPIAYDTRYLLKIRSVNTVGTPTVFFSVNGGVEVANTATIPVNAVSQTPFGLFSVVIVNAVGGTGSNPSFSWKVAQLKRGASSR